MADIVIYNEDADTTEYGVYKNDLYMLGWEHLGGKEPNALPFSYWREYFVANDHRRDNIKAYYEGLHVHILNRIQNLTDPGGWQVPEPAVWKYDYEVALNIFLHKKAGEMVELMEMCRYLMDNEGAPTSYSPEGKPLIYDHVASYVERLRKEGSVDKLGEWTTSSIAVKI